MRQSSPEVHTFFDEATNAACHIVKDPASNAVAIIDSILDFDAAAGRTETTHADKLIDEITQNDWQVAWILETHVCLASDFLFLYHNCIRPIIHHFAVKCEYIMHMLCHSFKKGFNNGFCLVCDFFSFISRQ